MRVLLLKDHVFPVNPISPAFGIFKARIGGNAVRYRAGQMLDVGADRCFIVNGQPTGHRLSDDHSAWTSLLTRKECDQEQYGVSLELAAALETLKHMEDRARDAEHEAKECREAMKNIQSDLNRLHPEILAHNERVYAATNAVWILGVSNGGMGVFTCPETQAQTQEEDSERTRTNHS